MRRRELSCKGGVLEGGVTEKGQGGSWGWCAVSRRVDRLGAVTVQSLCSDLHLKGLRAGGHDCVCVHLDKAVRGLV